MLLYILLFICGNILTSGHEYNNLMKFTDFIQHLTQILNKYEDADLEHFFQIFNDEIKTCPHEECFIIELLDNNKLKVFLKDSLTDIKQKTATDIRLFLNAVHNKLKYDKNNNKFNKLVEIINSLYNKDFIETFKAILYDVDEYRFKKNNDLVDLKHIISEAIKYVLIYHYNELNDNTRINLKTQLENYFNSLKPHTASHTLKEFILNNNSSVTVKPRIKPTRIKVSEQNVEDESFVEVYTTNKILSTSNSISTIRQSKPHTLKRITGTTRKDTNKNTQSTKYTNVETNDTKRLTTKIVESGVKTHFEALRPQKSERKLNFSEQNQEKIDLTITNTPTNNIKISTADKSAQNVNLTRHVSDFDAAKLTSSADTSSAEGLSIEIFE